MPLLSRQLKNVLPISVISAFHVSKQSCPFGTSGFPKWSIIILNLGNFSATFMKCFKMSGFVRKSMFKSNGTFSLSRMANPS